MKWLSQREIRSCARRTLFSFPFRNETSASEASQRHTQTAHIHSREIGEKKRSQTTWHTVRWFAEAIIIRNNCLWKAVPFLFIKILLYRFFPCRHVEHIKIGLKNQQNWKTISCSSLILAIDGMAIERPRLKLSHSFRNLNWSSEWRNVDTINMIIDIRWWSCVLYIGIPMRWIGRIKALITNLTIHRYTNKCCIFALNGVLLSGCGTLSAILVNASVKFNVDDIAVLSRSPHFAA